PERLLQAYHSLKQNGVDGIISFSHDYAQFGCRLDSQFEDDPRIVFVLNTPEQTGSSVDVDYHGGMAQALTHLREQGYRSPALLMCGGCVDPVEKLTRSNKKRLEGFLRNCPGGDFFLLKPEISEIPRLYDECRKLIREKLNPAGIDAIIAHNDDLAALFLKALLAEKVRVPQDFGVIGFDNLPLGEYLPVTLSTLYYDKKELADSALKILQDKIAGKSAPVRLSCQVKFIPRESSRRRQS
ncbi:MAG: LacI family DNA-binding transcriptional regulator, partial [Lentisphaeria bacterium]|nr:LacI family DNA-binding transcriptional regulator [Lentisphaeria bacterium]